MFCKNCGRQIPDNAAFCPGCGTKRSDGDTSADERSSADIRNLPNYAREIDRSGHAVDSDRKKFSLSDPDRKKFSLSDSGRDKFSLSDSGRDKFSLSDKSRKGDDGGIVRLTTGREPAAPKKEPAAPPKEPAAPPKLSSAQEKGPAAPPKESAGFVNPLKDAGGTVFRSGSAPNSTAIDQAKDKTTTSANDTTAGHPASFVRPERTAPREPDAVLEEDKAPGGFVNPLKDAGLDIRLGRDGDRNQPAEDLGEINPPYLKFATVMVVLSCTCCNPVTLILGIIAVVFALQTASSFRFGQYGIAAQKAMVARVLCWIAFGLLAVWILLWVAMLCLPMPEDHTGKSQTEQTESETEKKTGQVDDQSVDYPTEQVEDENVDHPMEQTDGESSTQEVQTEQTEAGNIKSAEPDHHHSNLGLLLDILD